MGLNFGFIGVGQGGGNVTDVFAKKYPAIAINTAKQDLDSLQNVSKDLQVYCQVSAGGAGKDMRLGELAVEDYQQRIRDLIQVAMNNTSFIYVIVGLGGGTGSLGALRVCELLAQMEKDFGMICLLPTADASTNEKINASVAFRAIQNAHIQSKHFCSTMFVSNEKLIKQVLEAGKYSWEKYWQKANEMIFTSIDTMCEFTKRSTFTSFDPEEYRNVIKQKGAMIYAEGEFELSDNNSILTSKVLKMWMESPFLAGESKFSTGATVLIERPEGFDQDGTIIHDLYLELKKHLGSGIYCKGVYSANSGNLVEKMKNAIMTRPIKIYTVLSGLPFPETEFVNLAEQAAQELASLKEKKVNERQIGEDNYYNAFLDHLNQEETTNNNVSFAVFGGAKRKNPNLKWQGLGFNEILKK